MAIEAAEWILKLCVEIDVWFSNDAIAHMQKTCEQMASFITVNLTWEWKGFCNGYESKQQISSAKGDLMCHIVSDIRVSMQKLIHNHGTTMCFSST